MRIALLIFAFLVDTVAAQLAPAQRDVRRILSTRVPHYRIKAANLLEAAAEFASDFNLPMGIEWQGAPDMKNEIEREWNNTTAERVLYDLATSDVEYQVEVSNDVVHLRKRGLAEERRNPLNVKVAEFAVTDMYAGQARAKLQGQINTVISPPQTPQMAGAKACAGSYGAGAGDELVTLSMKNAVARSIFDALLVRSRFVMWLAVFPDKQMDTGYLITAPPGRNTMQQPDVDFLTRYYDPVAGKSRGDWEIGLRP